MKLNTRIRVVRHSLELSQAGLADGLGVSRSAVCNWECGLAVPTGGNLLLLAELAHVSFEWLAMNRGRMKPDTPTYDPEAVDALLVYEADEMELIARYRQASARQKAALLQFAGGGERKFKRAA